MKRNHSIFVKIIAFCLIIALATPVSATPAAANSATPRASYYIDAYNTYICPMGGGELQIWYEIMGTGDMDEIGTLSIRLYESNDNIIWTWVYTFFHESNPTMLAYDDWYHCSYVSFPGTRGKYYKAEVCLWAGKDGGGDSRYMWTPAERAL